MPADLRSVFEHVIDWPPPQPAVEAVTVTCPDPDAAARRLSARNSDPLPGGGGVYLLTDREGQLIQLAAAADLRRTLRHRLASPETPQLHPGQQAEATEPAPAVPGNSPPQETPSKRPDLGAIVRRIWWRPASSAFELTWEYYRLARLLLPHDYLEQVAFGPAWFLHVDPAAPIPRLQAGKYLRGRACELGGGMEIGPFGTQSDATRFIEILQEVFDLCRYEHILERAPLGQACAYFEMGKCPAPCNGSIPMSRYREMIASATAFALGNREPVYEHLGAEMRQAAARREFEKAAVLKQKLERARGIEHEAFRLVRRVEEFNYLIVQSGGSRTRLRPFYVRRGAITAGEIIRIKDLPQAAGRWIEEMHSCSCGDDLDPRQRSEQIWLVSKFLFKKDTPGLFVHASTLSSPGELAQRVRARWLKPEPTE